MLSIALSKKGSSKYTYTNPNTSYTETYQKVRTKFDFSKINVVCMRIVVTAQGNEAGAGKGIEIYDVTGTQSLCEVTWDGNAAQQGLAGAWTNTNIPTVDSVITIRVKGSSATEDIDLYQAELQIFYA